MKRFIKGTQVNLKQNKLRIGIRSDKYKKTNKLRSQNYSGVTYISGREKMVSSGTSIKKKAIKILSKWFDELHFKKKHNIGIHETSFKDCLKEWYKFLEKDHSIRGTTKKFYKSRFDYGIKRCTALMNAKVSSITVQDINKLYLNWRYERAKKQGRKLKGITLKGDLASISKFLNWCYKNKFRKTRIENLTIDLLSKKLRHQSTQRIGFTKDEYNKMLEVSRKRIKKGRNRTTRFQRERLHQFIVFMVGTGLRVSECLNLDFADIEMVDRTKQGKHKGAEVEEDIRYYLRINVGKSKTEERESISMSSAYFAFKRLINLYRSTGQGSFSSNVFNVSGMRDGFNALLDDCNLKTKKVGDRILKRDSKSLRNTYIQFCLDKGISSQWVAKNCGTSIAMIDKFYTANTKLENLLDTILQTGRTKLKVVS